MATSTYCLITALVLAGAVLLQLWARARAVSDMTGVVTLRAGAIVGAVLVGATVGLAQVALGVMLLDFDLWDLLSVLYYDLVVAVPLVGLGVLVGGGLHGRWPRFPALTRPVTGLAVLALVPGAIGWYATRVEPFGLQVEEVAVPVDPAREGDEPLTIGVISDIQTVSVGSHEREAVDRLVATEPDVIVFTGDLFQGEPDRWPREVSAFYDLLAQLEAPGGVYVVPGDTDDAGQLRLLAEGLPVTVLVDEVATVEVRDRVVKVAGVSLTPTGTGLDVLERMQSVPGEEIRILAAHRPDWVLRLEPDSRIDLTVAGHTHGGQVQLPGFGPLMTMSHVPRAVAAGGLHEVDGNRVYVSTGVGREQQGAPQVRFLAPPSIAVVTLDG
jgi:predicted MPP superfamily phosphohydrolase